MDNWARLRKRLKRSFGDFSFVRVYEQHESGEFHIHAVITYAPKDTWTDENKRTDKWHVDDEKKRWRYRGEAYQTLLHHVKELGLGYICDFTPLLNTDALGGVNGIVKYITKYMTKSNILIAYVRRIQTSPKIGSPKKRRAIDDNETWELKRRLNLDDIFIHGEIRDLSRKKLIDFHDFFGGYYPQEIDN